MLSSKKKLVKIGGSFYVSIPKVALDMMDWKEDDELAIEQGSNEGELKIVNGRVFV